MLQGLGFEVERFRFVAYVSGFGVQSLGLRVVGSGLLVSGFGIRAYVLGFEG